MLVAQVDTVQNVQLFHAPSTPVPVFEEIIDIKKGDEFSLERAKRLQLRFYESELYEDVTLLFYKKDDGAHLQYYFKEDKRPFVYAFSPYLTVKNNLGVTSSVLAKNIFDTSTSAGLNFNYSKDDYAVAVLAKDRFWRDRTEFRFELEWFKENYLFTDLAKTERYAKEGNRSELSLTRRIGAEESLALLLRRSRFDRSSSAQNSEHRLTTFGLGYKMEQTDWPLFPQRGYELGIAGYYTAEKDKSRTRHADFYAAIYSRFAKYFLVSARASARQHFDSAPHYLGYHLDGKREALNLYSQSFFARSFALLEARLYLLGSIEYDPFFKNGFMLGVSTFATGGTRVNNAGQKYHQFGGTCHVFYEKNRIDISVSRDIFDHVFLHITTSM